MNGKAQVAGTAGAKALRWEGAWSVRRTSGVQRGGVQGARCAPGGNRLDSLGDRSCCKFSERARELVNLLS